MKPGLDHIIFLVQWAQTKLVHRTLVLPSVMCTSLVFAHCIYGFKEYFEYRMMCGCGIPGVTMVGAEDDWKVLLEKHEKLEKFLKPLDDVSTGVVILVPKQQECS